MMKGFRGSKFFLLLGVALISFAGIYFALLKNQISPSLPKNSQKGEARIYSKRQFDINSKFYLTQGYPSEVIDTKEDNLLGISCSQQYVRQMDKWYSDYDNKTELKDANLLRLIESASLDLKGSKTDSFIFFAFCAIENGGTIVKYEKWAGGGGSRNVVFFGVLNTSGSVEEVTNIKNDGMPYFTCNRPLQLTASNILYYGCGGGDGGSGSASIYKIDLNKKTSTRIIKCDSSANPNGKPLLQCQ